MTKTTILPDVSDLTLEEKIGQMLCLGWGGPDSLLNVNEQAQGCVRDLKAGGMILMGRNVQPQVKPLPDIDAAGVRAMLDELQSFASIPLFVSSDQEGGRVARFGSTPFTRMPSAKTIGDRGDTELAYAAAKATGVELAAVGVNWNFAPDADVNSNPDNPVIGNRSFGDNAALVAEMVAAQVKGYLDGGVLPCAKHFPGHGDTAQDSHYALPSLPHDRATMDARELVPFRAAIEAGIPSIMTAHILFPAVDASGLPATMSKAILTDLLRNELGFDGLIVTDCMEMKAVSDHWGTPRGAVLAAIAGADVLLVCHTWERQKATRDALLEAAHSGELPQSRIDDAVTRILAAKRRLLTQERPALSVIGTEEHRAVQQALAEPDATLHVPTTLGAEAPV
jgi:beta-N-acetylhexosaminidase